MAQTSSLNCLPCRIPYQTIHSLNWLPLFTEKPFFSLISASSHPLPKNRLVLVEGRPNCERQSSTVSVLRVARGWYCHPGRHANVVTPCLFALLLNDMIANVRPPTPIPQHVLNLALLQVELGNYIENDPPILACSDFPSSL